MGVPRLFMWLRKRYPDAFRQYEIRRNASLTLCSRMKDNVGTNFAVDNLYIDGNAIVHACAQKVYNYGEHKRMLDPYSSLNFEEKEFKLFELVFNRMIELSTIAIPKVGGLLYIAIDGCAPAAKMVQQRQRRFLAVAKIGDFENGEVEKNDDAVKVAKFNPNCISPGTDFIVRLCDYIEHRILIEASKGALFTFALSNANVPGEGEHKIVEYIRSHPEVHSMRNCIYGPDGDLIMLVLASPSKDFFILRDDLDIPNSFVSIDMGSVRRSLVRDLRSRCTPEESERTVRDFIAMCFLVGNDFLPKIRMFYQLEDGMTTMFDIYMSEFSKSTAKRFLTEGDNVSCESLKRFIRKVAQRERFLLSLQLRRMVDSRIEEKFVDNELVAAFEDPNTGTVVDARSTDEELFRTFDFDEYRKLYNDRFVDLKDAQQRFIEGLFWTFNYYISGCPNFRWFYPHYDAPLMIDLANCDYEAPQFERCSPHEPFQQLLSILPPKSASLLPEELRSLMTSKKSPLAKLYPTSFDVDYRGKYKEHQGIPLLPFIDQSLIESTYVKCASKQLRSCSKNRRSVPFSYAYSDNHRRIRTRFGLVESQVEIRKL